MGTKGRHCVAREAVKKLKIFKFPWEEGNVSDIDRNAFVCIALVDASFLLYPFLLLVVENNQKTK